jgi:hypothetical protein
MALAVRRVRPMWLFAFAGALVLAALVAVVTVPRGGPLMPGAVLTSGTNFGLSGTVSNLTPGVSSSLVVSVTNPYSAPITVTSLTVEVAPTPTISVLPANCPVSNLTLNGQVFAGATPTVVLSGLSQLVAHNTSANISSSASDGTTSSNTTVSSATLFTVANQYNGWAISDSKGAIPAGTTITTETAGAGYTATLSQAATSTQSSDTFILTPSLLLAKGALGNGPTDHCQNVTFPFVFQGTATYTATTSTVLTSSLNPSLFGQNVTFTATVTSSVTPDPGAGTPTGSVVFYECTAPANLAHGSPASSCTSSLALSPAETVNGSGKATFSIASLPTGSTVVFAAFTATDPTSYATSSSTTLTQVVNTTVACITGTVNGGYTVKSGQSICISGRVNGGVTVQSTGSLELLGATINGGVTATSTPGAFRLGRRSTATSRSPGRPDSS